MNSLRKQFYFTLFYFLTSIFAIINTMMYFLVTLPHAGSGDDSSPAEPEPSGLGMSKSPTELRDFGVGQSPLLPYGTAGRTPFTDMFGEGWFQAFTTLNLFVISTLIVLVEILFLNSVKRPYAIGAHIFGLLFLSGLYVAWAAVGRTVTGTGPFWLDGDEAGSREAVVANTIGFVVLSPISMLLPLLEDATDTGQYFPSSTALSRFERRLSSRSSFLACELLPPPPTTIDLGHASKMRVNDKKKW